MSSVNFSWCNNNGYNNSVINSCVNGKVHKSKNPIYNVSKSNLFGSSYTELIKCLTTTKRLANEQNSFESSVENDITMGGPTNVGGPGDFTLSIEKCCKASGRKGRLRRYAVGVDKKHGSFDRYLSRKKGWVLRCQNDDGTASKCMNSNSNNIV